MRDYVDDYLKKSDKTMSNSLQMVVKLLILGLVSAAVTDLLRTLTPFQGRMAELIGLLSGVMIQQIIPPRLTIGKLALVSGGICAVIGILFFLHR